jgi:hypothetical protein
MNGRVAKLPEGLYGGGVRAECGPCATGCGCRVSGRGRAPAEHVLLLFVSAIKLVVEIALMALAGQFVLGLLAGAKRDGNIFYRTLQVVTGPVLKSVRWMAPRVVLDRHIPLAALVLLASAWMVATVVKVDLCLRVGMELCR